MTNTLLPSRYRLFADWVANLSLAEWFTRFTLFMVSRAKPAALPFRFWRSIQWVGSIPAEFQPKAEIGGSPLPLPIQTITKAILTPIRLRCESKNKKVPLEVKWDKENHLVEIYPQEPVPATAALSWYFLTLKIQTSVELTISTAKSSPLVIPLPVTSEPGF